MGYDFKSLTRQADEASSRNKFYTDFEDVDPNILHQITDLTKWMRTKGKGSDVREVIAQLFERTWLESTKEGNANIEVSKARGGFGTLSERLDEAEEKFFEIQRELEKTEGRISIISSLSDGSTTGDAELIDARSGMAGTRFVNAGDAIRGQGDAIYKDLQHQLDTNIVLGKWQQGSYAAGGNFASPNPQASKLRYRAEIPVTDKAELNISVETGYKFAYYLFNRSGTLVRNGGWLNQHLTLPATNGLLRLVVAKQDDSEMVPQDCRLSAHYKGEFLSLSEIPVPSFDSAYLGRLFVWVTNNSIRIKGAPASGLSYKGKHYSTANIDITLPTNNIDTVTALVFDGEYRNIPIADVKDELVLGYVYKRVFVTNNQRIIANAVPISTIKQRLDTLTQINFDRLGYKLLPVQVNGGDRKITDFGTFINVKNGYSDQRGFYLDAEYPVPLPVQFVQNTGSLANKKILTIGDSITNRGWYQKYLLDKEPSLQFVGTQPTQHHSLRAEGYSGRDTQFVFGPQGPFWFNGRLDFGAYVTKHQIAPDIVTVEFGLNEVVESDRFVATIQGFIDSVKVYNANIRVLVWIPFEMRKGPQQGANYGIVFDRYTRIKTFQCAVENLRNCELVPTHYVLNDQFDFDGNKIDYGYGDIQLDGVADAIHPSEAIGFRKFADVLYNYM